MPDTLLDPVHDCTGTSVVGVSVEAPAAGVEGAGASDAFVLVVFGFVTSAGVAACGVSTFVSMIGAMVVLVDSAIEGESSTVALFEDNNVPLALEPADFSVRSRRWARCCKLLNRDDGTDGSVMLTGKPSLSASCSWSDTLEPDCVFWSRTKCPTASVVLSGSFRCNVVAPLKYILLLFLFSLRSASCILGILLLGIALDPLARGVVVSIIIFGRIIIITLDNNPMVHTKGHHHRCSLLDDR